MNIKTIVAPALAAGLALAGSALLSAPDADAQAGPPGFPAGPPGGFPGAPGAPGAGPGFPGAGPGGPGFPVPTPNPLLGTKCWELAPVVGKPVFLEMHFLPLFGSDHALLSGRAVRADGNSPDRVLQFSGSASRHSFIGSDASEINRILIDAHYSMSKTGTDPANAFVELGRTLEGHYNIRLDADSLNGAFEGHDLVHDWTPPLSGPSGTQSANSPANAFFGVAGDNNYLGSITCDGSIPGFDNCGTIVPFNNSGSLTLQGSDPFSCAAAAPQ